MENDTVQLRGGDQFPEAIAHKPAASALFKALSTIKKVEGWGFSTAQKVEQARVLRVLADQIEAGEALVQGATFETITDVDDFVNFRWTVRFAERSVPVAEKEKAQPAE